MPTPHPWRTLVIPTIIAVLVTAAVGAISLWRVYNNDRWVSHTYEVRSALDTLMLAMVDAETGQRGLIITGDDTYLEPYQRGTSRVHSALEQNR